MRYSAGIVAFLALPLAVFADVKLHPLFCDNMVLQRNSEVMIWGTADAGEKITIHLEQSRNDNFGKKSGIGQATTVHADDDGKWKVRLTTKDGGYEATLSIRGKNEINVKNIAIGDVWLCSGQSNMEWKLNQLKRDDQGKKVASDAVNKNIRLFTVPNRPFREPQKDFPASKTEGLWLECTPENVIDFSAVGYFFGREIEKTQKVPVGLIAADWGGTPCQAWTSKAGLEAQPALKDYLDTLAAIDEAKFMAEYEAAFAKYKEAAAKAKEDGKPAPRAPAKPQNGGVTAHTPTALYNGMIAPLLPFKIKGAIWYQGESNASKAKEYRTLFPAMIADWRKQWGETLPFFAVQLAPFQADGSDKVSYAELRDAQFHATKVLPKVGMAVITDVGDEKDIHPQRKEPVGVRLALAARALTYGENIEYSGPLFKDLKLDGNRAVLSFDHLGGGLVCKGDELAGFTVCGEDKAFHPAKAEFKGDTVVVTCDKVDKPVAVRFGWCNFAKPELNFFNKAGLPAVPFRTDEFPLTTK